MTLRSTITVSVRHGAATGERLLASTDHVTVFGTSLMLSNGGICQSHVQPHVCVSALPHLRSGRLWDARGEVEIRHGRRLLLPIQTDFTHYTWGAISATPHQGDDTDTDTDPDPDHSDSINLKDSYVEQILTLSSIHPIPYKSCSRTHQSCTADRSCPSIFNGTPPIQDL